MASVWFRCQAELRSRWRSWVGLTLLIAISAGVVLFTLAGARRTDTAWDRLASETNAHDVFVIGQQFDFDLDAVARLPEVADFSRVGYVAAATDISEAFELTPLVSQDGGYLGRISRPKIMDGRRLNPDRADEIAITPPVAEEYGLKVGSAITLKGFSPQQFAELLSGGVPPVPAGAEVRLRVVAIQVSATEGELVASTRSENNVHLTPAFARAYAGRIAMGPAVAIRLKRGAADTSAFKLGVERIAAGRPVQLTTRADEGSQVRDSVHTEALALELFAAFAGLAALLAVGQALSRQTFIAASDHPALRALGATRRQLWAATMLRAGLAGFAGALLAVVLSVAASPLMPFGLARLAEPSPGLSLDAGVAGLGLLVTPVLVIILAALPAWQAGRAHAPARLANPDTTRPVQVAERMARLGFPPTAVTGVHLAMAPGSGRTSAPTRSAILGTAFSIAALTTALAFGASLDRLFSTPRLYGWNWDVAVGNPFTTDLADRIVPALQASSAVGGFSSVAAADVEIGGLRTQAYGFDTIQGDVVPPVIEGRAPRQRDEIVLGAKVLRGVDREIGELVEVRVADTVAEFRIVGKAVFAQLSIFQIEALGNGALFTGDGLRRLVPEAQQNIFPLRWAAGVDPQAAQQEFARTFGETIGFSEHQPPLEIADFGRVDGLPGVLSALVALMAAASLAHALVTTTRRRRRDLAILKTLGFVRRQVSATVAWQATTMTVVALALGLALGIAAGSWAWRLFAANLGIVPQPVVPLVALLVTAPAAILVANVVAALPGRVAARTPPALVLNAE